MKNFLDYLAEAQKTYEFRVKVANVDPSEKMDCLESCLEAYSLESITKPKSLPIQENHIDFPAMKSPEVYVMDLAVRYPVQADQVRAIIAERLNVSQNQVSVVPAHHPEELWRNGEGELREYKQGEAVLDKELEDNPEGKKAGESFAEKFVIMKELKAAEAEIESGEAPQTLNDIPAGEESPVGSNAPKKPEPKSSAR